MDAVIGNMRTSLEGGVRKMLTGQLGPKKASLALQADKNKTASKVFGVPLTELCSSQEDNVPYVVKDICQFIKDNHLDLEGIFRISASNFNTSRLREAFEKHSNSSLEDFSVTIATEVDGHTAANVLKQFLRQLPIPLIDSDVLKLCKEARCVSDESFATSVRSCMATWPASHRSTLQYLLSFLILVMQNTLNRMNVTGLAVVFGPNSFKISPGLEGLAEQATANKAFERLLLTTDIVCDNTDDEGYLAMPSPDSTDAVKPIRPAPPIPMQARPLPPPPVPMHIQSDDTVIYETTEPPSIPHRYESLKNHQENAILSSAEFSEDESNFVEEQEDEEEDVNHVLVEDTIHHVVKKRLFTADSSSTSSCMEGDDMLLPLDERDHDDIIIDYMLPSVTAGRNKGPKRRKPSRYTRNSEEDYPSEAPSSGERFTDIQTSSDMDTPTTVENRLLMQNQEITMNNDGEPHSVAISAATTVTTPDSGCLTAEDEVPVLLMQKPSQVPRIETVYIPKLDLSEPMDEEEMVCDVTEVPRLDLSEVAPPEEVVRPKPLPRTSLSKPNKIKKKKRKENRTSPHALRASKQINMSEPINVPQAKINVLQENLQSENISPEASPSRWRDAWSTDEESYPTILVPNETYNNNHIRGHFQHHDTDIAPSSPPQHDGFLQHHQIHQKHHHQHHHHKHHHHGNSLARPKITNHHLTTDDTKLEEIIQTLSEIMISLDSSRKECARPEDLTLMTRDQIGAEKVAMQKELLRYEDRHGRPSSKKEKEVMRSVYDRYRMVKRLMMDAMSPPFHAVGNRRYDDIEPVNDYELATNPNDMAEEFAVTQVVTLAPVGGEKVHYNFEKNNDGPSHVAGDLNLTELLKQQKEAKGKRKRLRRRLRDFENEFEKQNERHVLPADRVVMATEYGEYRDLKAKIRLLEALIEKQKARTR